MSNLTPTSMLFAKSTTLILSFIPFSSHNPDQQTGGTTGLLFDQLCYRLCFQHQLNAFDCYIDLQDYYYYISFAFNIDLHQ